MENFKVSNSEISDVKIFEPIIFEDNRGYFFESFNQKAFNHAVGSNIEFVQDNHSKSVKGVLRGLHYQKMPFEQGKLVRVIHGEIWDVAVDMRKYSDSYGKWVAEKLSADNKKQLWMPNGFAHGFLVISDFAEVVYKVDKYYNPKFEDHISFDDPFLGIEWPDIGHKYILSKKDAEKKFLI